MASKKELVELAEELGIDEPNKMNKADLEAAIEDARAGATRKAGVTTVADSLEAGEIVSRKDGGEAFAAIAKDMGLSLAVVMTAYIRETEGVIAATPEDVAKARLSGQGWRAVAARAGVSKAKAKALFAASGEDDIERGTKAGKKAADKPKKATKKAAKKATAAKGDDEGDAKPKAKKASKKKATKKAATKKAAKAETNGLPDWDSADEGDIREAIEGKTVTTDKGDEVTVDEILRFGRNKAKKRVVQVDTEDGKANIVLERITAVA
jgi:hypothetical protein